MHVLACRPIALPAAPRTTPRAPLAFLRFRLLRRPFFAAAALARA